MRCSLVAKKENSEICPKLKDDADTFYLLGVTREEGHTFYRDYSRGIIFRY